MMKKIFGILSLFFVSGCFGGYSPDSTFYTLKTFSEVTPLSQTTLSLGVDVPELPEYVDRPQIVSFLEDNAELNIDETNRWSDDLDVMIQRVIAADLRAYLPKAAIKPRTSLLEKYKYILNVSVERFDLLKDKAYFEALWSVKSGSSFNVVYKGKTSLEMPIDDGYNKYINAMSKMISQMSKQIAQKLIKN